MKNYLKTKKKINKKHLSLGILVAMAICMLSTATISNAKSSYSLIVLTNYSKTLNIGDEFLLAAVSSSGNRPVFRSSSSAVASVDANGCVTAKKAGSCKIYAKDGKSETYCKVKVLKTKISLNKKAVSLEHNACFRLVAKTSNNSEPTFKSNKISVATVSENGVITGHKPGNAVITVKADNTTVQCTVTVKEPTLKLTTESIKLYRNQTAALSAYVSSGIKPTWKSSKSSVATINENGIIVAKKHGTATITAKVDDISRTCQVTVMSPSITLSDSSVKLKPDQTIKIGMSISSGNVPVWSSNKQSVATVDQYGNITAHKKGSATISVTEDGTTAKCKVRVISKK